MVYQHNIQGCYASSIGEHGLDEKSLSHNLPSLQEALLKFQKIYDQGSLPHFKLPFVRKDLSEVHDLVLRFQDSFSNIIILGTGGSSLGGQTLTALSNQNDPKLYFMDNIDPHTFSLIPH